MTRILLRKKIIGHSEQQRKLVVGFLGRTESKLRVFVMAGQHGDEEIGRKAVRRFIELFSKPHEFESRFPGIWLAILENANPDGAANKTRNNARNVDLNRDHLLLESKENQAIHQFVNSWRPHVIVDVHNFQPRRRHLLQKDLVVYYDCFIDFPTNPAIDYPFDRDRINNVIRRIKFDLSKLGISCERYTLIKPSGKARHSTPDIIDARNFLALRYEALTVLIEGRSPTRDERSLERKHLMLAQYHTLLSVLNQVCLNSQYLTTKPKRMSEKIPLRAKYVLSSEPLKMIFKNARTKRLDPIVLPKYARDIVATEYVNAPAAYAVPLRTRTMDILCKHSFRFERSDEKQIVEDYVADSQKKYVARSSERVLKNFAIFPVNQVGGRALVLMLEPRSKYLLARYIDLDSPKHYPILRIVGRDGTRTVTPNE